MGRQRSGPAPPESPRADHRPGALGQASLRVVASHGHHEKRTVAGVQDLLQGQWGAPSWVLKMHPDRVTRQPAFLFCGPCDKETLNKHPANAPSTWNPQVLLDLKEQDWEPN